MRVVGFGCSPVSMPIVIGCDVGIDVGIEAGNDGGKINSQWICWRRGLSRENLAHRLPPVRLAIGQSG